MHHPSFVGQYGIDTLILFIFGIHTIISKLKLSIFMNAIFEKLSVHHMWTPMAYHILESINHHLIKTNFFILMVGLQFFYHTLVLQGPKALKKLLPVRIGSLSALIKKNLVLCSHHLRCIFSITHKFMKVIFHKHLVCNMWTNHTILIHYYHTLGHLYDS